MKRGASPWAFLRDRASAAAVEFALIAPVMIIMFLGTIEITNVIRVQQKLNVAAGQLAEIIAGQPTATEGSAYVAPGGTLGDICTGMNYNLLPYNTTGLTAYMGSITAVNKGLGPQLSLDWMAGCPTMSSSFVNAESSYFVTLGNTPRSMYTQDGTPLPPNTIFSNNLVIGYSAIEVQLVYRYANVLPYLLSSSITLTAAAVARPRSDKAITCTIGNTTSPCPGSP